MIAPRPRPPERRPTSRPYPGPHQKRPMARRAGPARPFRMARSLKVLPAAREAGTTQRVGCRRFRRHQPPGPGRATPGLRGRRAVLALRGYPGRRRLRPPRRTSGAPGPARPVRLLRGRAVQRVQGVQGASVQAGPQVGLTSRPRELGPGRLPRGPLVRVRPGRVRPGQADPAPGRVVRVLAPGQAITRSARPRLAWGQRLRPGRKRLVRLASPVPGVRDSRRAHRAPPVVPADLARAHAAPAGPACPMAGPVRAAPVPAAPGRAR